MTKSEQIREILLRRYPCAEIPYGALAEIAREVGSTTELVRQQALKLGMATSVPVSKEVRLCAGGCGTPVGPVKDFCNSCTWIDLPCEECGALVRRQASALANAVEGSRRRHERTGNPLATGRAFCNRECFGRWVSKYRKRNAASGGVRSAPGPEEWHGTVRGYGYLHCRCEACCAANTAYKRAWLARKKAGQA